VVVAASRPRERGGTAITQRDGGGGRYEEEDDDEEDACGAGGSPEGAVSRSEGTREEDIRESCRSPLVERASERGAASLSVCE